MNHFSPTHSLHDVHGIIAPLVTPLLAQDTLDCQGLEYLIEHVLSGGVHGIQILGHCGEGPSLSRKIHYEMMAHTCRRVRGRVPVLVGIANCAFAETVALAEHAYELKANGLVISMPYYYANSQLELASYVRHLHHELRLPFVLCVGQSLAGGRFEADTLSTLLDLPMLQGLWDTSICSADDRRAFPLNDFSDTELKILATSGDLADRSRMMKVAGVVAECANLFPDLFVNWFESFQDCDDERCHEYLRVIEQLAAIFRIGGEGASTIKSLKAGLAHLNICGDLAAEPFQPLEEPENAAIAAILEGVEHQLDYQFRHLSVV